MLKICPIKSTDIPAVAEIHRVCWQVAYRGLLPQTYLDSLTLESFERRWTNGIKVNDDVVRLLALEKKTPIGFIVGLENRTPEKCPEATGEAWALYVHPDHWRKGAGKFLLEKFQESMRQKGHKRIFLWVLGSNLRGRKFYESVGGELYPATQSLEINGESFEELAYLF